MSTYAQIRAGLLTQLQTLPGINVAAEWPDQVVPPAVCVKLVAGTYEQAFGAGGDEDTDITLEIVVLLGLKGGLANAQRNIELYLDNVGTRSIRAAVIGDRTLGGVAQYTFVRGWRAYDTVEVNGAEWMGATVDVEVKNT